MSSFFTLRHACLLGLTALPAVVLGNGNSLVYGNVSGWTIYTDPANAYRCFARAEYEGGSAIQVGFNSANASLYVKISESAWSGSVVQGEQDLAVGFDEDPPMHLTAAGVPSEASLVVTIPERDTDAFLSDFSARYSLTVGLADREPLMLSLGGSRNATRLLEDCQSAMARVAGRETR